MRWGRIARGVPSQSQLRASPRPVAASQLAGCFTTTRMTNDSGRALTLLNDSGFPFQHACAHRIALLDGYQLAVEVPFTHPVTNGPLVGLPGTSDIIAVHPARSADLLVCFVIECKRASARIKNWVFVTNQRQSPRWPTFIYSTQLPAQGNQLAVTRSVTFPELGYQR